MSALLLQAVVLFAATAGAAGEQNVGPAAFASCLALGAPPSQRATRPLHAAPSFPGFALRASAPTKLRLSGSKLARTQGYGGLRGLAAGAKDAWSFTGANTALQDMLGMGAGVTGQDVCTFRHDGLGTGTWTASLAASPSSQSCDHEATDKTLRNTAGLELWHGSFGWFDFVTCAGAPVVLTDTWGIQVGELSVAVREQQVKVCLRVRARSLNELNTERCKTQNARQRCFPLEASNTVCSRRHAPTLPPHIAPRIKQRLMRNAATQCLQASKAPDGGLYRMPEGEQPIKAGTWTAKVEGDYIVIKNQYASRQSIVLSDTGFVFLGSRGTSIAVTNAQPPVEMPLEDALALVPGVLLK